jgi:signal transduction histidine kinase
MILGWLEGGFSVMARRTGRLKTYLWGLMILWTGVVCGLFLLDSLHLTQTVKDMAVAEARAYLNKDQASRLWAASHGGVYVPISDKTQPNPFLSHLPERDIQTPAGRSLTLMNPAYMIRQIMDHYAELYGVRSRITGLKHFSEATAPDDWEKSALMAFKGGHEEIFDFSEIGGAPFLRAMRALATETECLKCHAHQGYRVGDVRGGVSVSVPMAPYLHYRTRELKVHGLSFAILWLMGIGGTLWAGRRLAHSMQRRDRAETALRASEEQLKQLSARLLQQQEAERQDIARAIHEDIAQVLSAIKLRVECALDELGRKGIQAPVGSLQPVLSDINRTVRSIRKLAQRLQPLVFGYLGIRPAVAWIGRETVRFSPGLLVEQHLDVEESQVPEGLKTVVFRTIEDVLCHLSSHGRTGRTEITLKAAAQRLVLTIHTPVACAFPDSPIADGAHSDVLDIPKLKRRVESCGGNFEFESRASGGTGLTASWPLK